MAYQISWTATVEWIGEGVGPQAVAASQSFETAGIVPVVGGVQGTQVTSGNLTTAATTTGTNIGTAITTATALALIQGWQTGNN